MEVVYRCCCGIDVHKKLIEACLDQGGRQELRELTRYRKSLIEERGRETNRLQKILEGANIKLDSVVKDINGKSSRKLLEKIIANEVPDSDEVSKVIHSTLDSLFVTHVLSATLL